MSQTSPDAGRKDKRSALGADLVFCIVQFVRIGISAKRGEGTLGLGALAERSEAQGQRLLLLAILAVFVAAIPWLGTTLGLFLVMLATMWVLGVRRLRVLLAVSLATAATMYILFIALLQTRLPAGPVEQFLNPLLRGGG